METLIMLAAGTLLIALGMRLIHRLNAQHDARIAAYRFSDPYPVIARPPGHRHHGPADRAPGRTGTWP
ncbi:hypothetical protein [Streptomyces sp. SP18CS02]|uniref:hypothetical protein n=1 Tax=Streptomyces sp. SP18CS02 TaxID=3002531 RepID=UPI002E788193|nr:hypothetical protein [Streptomyces sp. SP18CS02]MEE1753531.1 hypothetical protein [Streptomyces sp. SP18CS02]